MKKGLIILGICGLIACTSNKKDNDQSAAGDSVSAGENQSASAQQSSADTNASKIGTEASASASPASKGQTLISNSDCLGCHKVNEKLVGPAYVEVANKYAPTKANEELLAGKIINGGSGVWGDVPMAAHPTISKEDATEMVKYILSLKSK